MGPYGQPKQHTLPPPPTHTQADYGPTHCLAPEWQPLLQQLGPASVASNSSAAAADAAGTGTISRDARRSRQLQRQRNQLLRNMATLVAGPVDGTAPPPQQPPRYGAMAELLGGLSDAALSAAERDWPGALAAAVGSTATPTGAGSGCWPVVLSKSDDGPAADVAAKRLSSRAGADSDASQGLRVYLCEQVRARRGVGRGSGREHCKLAGGGLAQGLAQHAALRCKLGEKMPCKESDAAPSMHAPHHPQDLPAGVMWLAAQPVVRWVEPQLRPQSRNAVSSILLQTGEAGH